MFGIDLPHMRELRFKSRQLKVKVEIKVETFGNSPVILNEAECREGSVSFPIEPSLTRILILSLNLNLNLNLKLDAKEKVHPKKGAQETTSKIENRKSPSSQLSV